MRQALHNSQNRKINIVVIKVIGVMADTTTIPVSKQFHDWLKSKGKKGESYEDIIKKLLNPESAQEIGQSQGTSDDDLGL